MNTKFVGVKEFRQDISGYVQKARRGKTRFVVVNRNKPLFELKPYADSTSLDSLVGELIEAERDIAAGKQYSQEEVLKALA